MVYVCKYKCGYYKSGQKRSFVTVLRLPISANWMQSEVYSDDILELERAPCSSPYCSVTGSQLKLQLVHGALRVVVLS